MKLTVYCYHLILWSGYSVVGWLSKKDSMVAKAILLLVFFYLAYLVAYILLKTRKGAMFISIVSLIFFMLGQQLFNFIFVY